MIRTQPLFWFSLVMISMAGCTSDELKKDAGPEVDLVDLGHSLEVQAFPDYTPPDVFPIPQTCKAVCRAIFYYPCWTKMHNMQGKQSSISECMGICEVHPKKSSIIPCISAAVKKGCKVADFDACFWSS